MPSKWLYDRLLEEKDLNPTRLKSRLDNKQTLRLTIEISKIDGKKIQQHFERLSLEPDRYIECEFKGERFVLPLNVGQSVNVYGRLHEAFDSRWLRPDSKAVKLKDCYY